MLKYSDIPHTVDYNIATLHRRRGHLAQIHVIPNSTAGVKRKVYELKKHAVATLHPETSVYSGVFGMDFDGVTIHNVGMDQLSGNASLDCLPCADKMIKPRGSYILAIRLAGGSLYDIGSYGDAGDEGNLPAPLSPRKLTDLANHGATSRKRQR